MSKYTTEVRFICESAIPLEQQGDLSDVKTAIECGRKKIFTFDYDLFDNNYKGVIETKFLRHYYTREIGHETVGLWKLKLEDKWLMKLPYYNKLWESAMLEFNPFNDVDYFVEHAGSGTSDRTDNVETDKSGTNTANADRIQKYSDTPQGGLDGVIDTDWLTNATQNQDELSGAFTENGSQDSTSNLISTDEYLRHVYGKMGNVSYSKLLKEYRSTFMNIDEMFIDEFKKLFMLVY